MNKHFFIIGAQRCGTTMLLHSLKNHPHIRMALPVKPEPKYFLRDSGSVSIVDYREKYFGGVDGHIACGEKSTTYIERIDAAQNILSIIPDAKFVAILRNPVERAISNYWFSVSHGLEKRDIDTALAISAEDAEATEGVSASPYDYIKRGAYLPFLERYEKVLGGASRLYVLQTEYLIDKPLKATNDIFDFLEVERRVSFKIAAVMNAAVREADASSSTKANLYEYYKPFSSPLAERYGFDLGLWSYE